MRIAQVVPAGANPYAGVRNAVVQLAVHLAKRGHDVELWPLHVWTDEELEVHAPVLGAAGVTICEAPPEPDERLDFLARRKVDLAHLHSVFTKWNARLARRLSVPYVVSPHGGYAPRSLLRTRWPKQIYKLFIERPMLRRAALRVALTQVEADDLRAFGAGEPVVVIPNGVLPVPRDVDRAAFRRDLGVADGIPLLVFVGRLDVLHKGLDILVEGLTDAPAWRAALVGPDHRGGGEALTALARRRGLGDRLTISPPLTGNALHQALAGADLFALTSRWEGLPLSLLEALGHGTPALVSPEVERLVGGAAAGAGWVASPARVGAALNGIAAVLDEERARRATAARALAARYDWNETVSRYEDAYREVLDRTSRT